MRQKLFISYSSADEDKVALVADVLSGNSIFEAVIIASNREPLKPLAQKVMDGLSDAWCVIPILTKNSIGTQWINQEIGYARGLNRQIAPIVDKSIINNLKGFIHREVDLPYSYLPNDSRETENEAFAAEFKKLIGDLEARLEASGGTEEPSLASPIPQSEFEKALTALDDKRGAEAFQQQKNSFFSSQDGEEATRAAFEGLVTFAIKRVGEINSKGLHMVLERHTERSEIVIKSGGHSVTFARGNIEVQSNTRAFPLWVIHWRGYVSFGSGMYINPPKRLKDWRYDADIVTNHHLAWTDQKSGSSKSSNDLVEESLTWLIGRTLNPTPTLDFDEYDEDGDWG